ncbi:DUF2786 domain-containing protein [Nocardia wallacei]|uniref:DUF2786 domain-containing protein n=1 Tax=Nocardia wallacei TaxID=480035 RepID=UPI002458C9C8|nr:DUF2786 domain-containing protein [Nocardia wallacei]
MTHAHTTRQDMLDKVRKLLAKAESVAGTPEADVLNAKAFELIAKYGIDETAARANAGEGPAPIEMVRFSLNGQYLREQAFLFQILAAALHCEPMMLNDYSLQVAYGTAGHIERLRVLFATLAPQMLAGAARQRPTRYATVGVKAFRMSWMRGFYTEIGARLREAESTAAAESGTGTELVLLDDAKRAMAALDAEHSGLYADVSRRSRHDGDAADAGAAAAQRVNLGQAGVGGRRAIGA